MKIQIVEKSNKLVTCYFNSYGRRSQQKLRSVILRYRSGTVNSKSFIGKVLL